VLRDDEVDAVIVIFVPPLVTQPDDVARAIRTAAGDAGPKPIVACFLGSHGIPDALRSIQPDERSIPSFAFPESAAAALGHAAGYGTWRRRPEGAVPDFPDVNAERARAIVSERVGSPDGVWLDGDVAQSLCDCFGLPTVRTMQVATASDAVDAAEELGYPVALKAGSGAIVHKTDVGAVNLNLASEAEVRDAFTSMQERLGDDMGGAIVQPMVGAGVEAIVGVTRDASFGSLVVFGMGGTAAELVRDTALRILPITDLDAREMVRSLHTSPLLFGYRGSPPADVEALEQLLLRVGRLADELPEVAEMDCNPVIVSPEAATIVDVKVRLVPLPPSPLPGVRRMR
jgi:acyl-CoA synthetase (NDP forming)